MDIGAYGSTMQQLGQAQQRAFDQADTNGDGSLSLAEFTTALQSQQAGTNASANPAAPVSTADATALYDKLDPNGDGKLTMQDLNQAGHHHGHHGGAGGLMNSDALGAVLGGQESASATSPGGLLSDISTAVQKAISGYFGTQQSSLA